MDTVSESVSTGADVQPSNPVESAAPPATESPAPAAATEKTSAAAEGLGVAAAPTNGAPVAPAPYTPNFKYKSYSKEFEFDDWAKGVIKDKETEEKVRSLYAKAAGLDGVKESFEKYKGEYTPQIEEFKAVKSGIEQISHFAKTKDFDNFFASLNIPLQNVYEWLERKVEEAKQPPHIQQEIAKNREFAKAQLQQQYQTRMLQEQNESMSRQYQEREFELFSQIPKVVEIQTQYESRMGEGAFKKLVLDRIELGRQQGQNLPVSEAIQLVSGTLEKFFGGHQAPGMSQPQMPNNGQAAPPAQQPGKPPVLPNISSGKGTSPIKAAPKTLDDIRKLAKEKNASENTF